MNIVILCMNHLYIHGVIYNHIHSLGRYAHVGRCQRQCRRSDIKVTTDTDLTLADAGQKHDSFPHSNEKIRREIALRCHRNRCYAPNDDTSVSSGTNTKIGNKTMNAHSEQWCLTQSLMMIYYNSDTRYC